MVSVAAAVGALLDADFSLLSLGAPGVMESIFQGKTPSPSMIKQALRKRANPKQTAINTVFAQVWAAQIFSWLRSLRESGGLLN
ncbi:hypothetical protein B1R94_20760 [Mycolicibacterium litorale]|nr:hypothetical protein B1R94_20760 [Mycolicibacterium litorale]